MSKKSSRTFKEAGEITGSIYEVTSKMDVVFERLEKQNIMDEQEVREIYSLLHLAMAIQDRYLEEFNEKVGDKNV